MNGDNRSYEDQILRAIDYGNLPQEEIERRLRNLIEAEISRTDTPADLEMIDACQSLLLEMHGQSNQLMISAEKAAGIDREIPNIDQHRFHSPKLVLRVVAITALLIIVVTISGFSLRLFWFEGHSTPDEQQYIVQGHVIDPGIINAAIAEHTQIKELSTDNAEELYSFLGFRPNIPLTIRSLWTAQRFSASFLSGQIRISVYYVSENNGTLLYIINIFTDMENARLSFEQNSEGIIREVDGNSIYVAHNEERLSLCWSKGIVVFRLSGNIVDQDIPLILQEIREGD